MPTDQEKYEQIERYLDGSMPPAEREAFEAALQQDKSLGDDLTLHRALHRSLGNRQRRELLDALADTVEEEAQPRPALAGRWLSPFRLAAAAAVLALLAAVGVWIYQPSPDEPPAVAEQPVAPPLPTLPHDSTPASTPPAGKPEKPGQLAMSDRRAFEPNRALDPLVGAMVRGDNASVRILKPGNDAVLPLQNGNADFALAGKAAEMTALSLRIYNNREADFAAGKTVFQTDISVTDSVFTLNKSLKLTPGRYYAVLSAPGEEEPLVVLRFYAGQR